MFDRFSKQFLGILTAAAIAGAFSLAAPATADAQVSFGVQGNYGTEVEAIGVGPRVNFDIPGAQGFGLAGSFDYFFPDGFDYWEINANATYGFAGQSNLGPYVGAGFNHANSEAGGVSVSNTGLNLLGGVEFGGGGITPFVEGRYATTGTGQLVLTGGILF